MSGEERSGMGRLLVRALVGLALLMALAVAGILLGAIPVKFAP